LDTIRVSEAVGTVLVWDGEGREYARLKSDGQVEFQVSGTLGTHHVVLTTGTGRIRERAAIRVNCETSVESSDETWSRLFGMLKWNLFKGREAKIVPFEGRPHRLFSDWLRDHCYIMRGKKYFDASVRDAVELFGRTQAEDGMVYDFIMPKTPQSTGPLRRFRNPGHVRRSDDPGYFLQRVPVEADVEYLYVDTLHQAWKAIGDTAWMTRWLDSAVRAMDYCRASDIR